ncbi:DUF2267 domain-containing protein [Leptolyngbya ohadii]|uniref:DUF2267 domain-containing protein n=1 Tax=Leptolyngbya ohadii TaxID=1962290 RepID=UPI000B5A05AD|nr:DUF2267 domain-containing protein [Leptolyngbya ohadii]
MAMHGLGVFDKTVQTTEQWVSEVAKELNLEDKHRAFQGLRATLHAVRNRMPMGEAAHLGAELPTLLAGFYYEGWKPESTPTKERTQAAFLETVQSHVHQYIRDENPGFEIEQLARAVFRVMSDRIPAGEMQDITHMLPAELKELFPEAVRA